MTLTEKRVRNAKPGPKLRMLWGTHIKGLGVRIYSSGVKSYVLSYRTRSDGLPARKRLTTLFPVNIVTLRDVRVQAAKKLVAIRNGEPGPRSNAGRQRTSLTPRSKPPVPDARLHSQLLRHLRTSCRPSIPFNSTKTQTLPCGHSPLQGSSPRGAIKALVLPISVLATEIAIIPDSAVSLDDERLQLPPRRGNRVAFDQLALELRYRKTAIPRRWRVNVSLNHPESHSPVRKYQCRQGWEEVA